jgi:hypothetical protein
VSTTGLANAAQRTVVGSRRGPHNGCWRAGPWRGTHRGVTIRADGSADPSPCSRAAVRHQTRSQVPTSTPAIATFLSTRPRSARPPEGPIRPKTGSAPVIRAPEADRRPANHHREGQRPRCSEQVAAHRHRLGQTTATPRSHGLLPSAARSRHSRLGLAKHPIIGNACGKSPRPPVRESASSMVEAALIIPYEEQVQRCHLSGWPCRPACDCRRDLRLSSQSVPAELRNGSFT